MARDSKVRLAIMPVPFMIYDRIQIRVYAELHQRAPYHWSLEMRD
jgi:hypothetical protein